VGYAFTGFVFILTSAKHNVSKTINNSHLARYLQPIIELLVKFPRLLTCSNSSHFLSLALSFPDISAHIWRILPNLDEFPKANYISCIYYSLVTPKWTSPPLWGPDYTSTASLFPAITKREFFLKPNLFFR